MTRLVAAWILRLPTARRIQRRVDRRCSRSSDDATRSGAGARVRRCGDVHRDAAQRELLAAGRETLPPVTAGVWIWP